MMKVRLELLANLTYQLDCVSGLPISCSAKNYRALWEREFLRSEPDRARMEEWRKVRSVTAIRSSSRMRGSRASHCRWRAGPGW
ncbi:hypothetical protein ACN28S_59275 [Cystobacter fuscus]